MKRGFWREFISIDDSVVDRKTVIIAALILLLATPVMGLCFAVVWHHIWTLGKPLDGPVVQLLIAMLGASTGGLGTALLSKFIGPPGQPLAGGPIAKANSAPLNKGG
jgi:hypothetical protein